MMIARRVDKNYSLWYQRFLVVTAVVIVVGVVVYAADVAAYVVDVVAHDE